MAKKKDSRDKVFIGIVVIIILLMVGIFLVSKFWKGQGQKTVEDLFLDTMNGVENEYQFMYNGFAFVYVDGLWYTKVKSGNKVFTLPFHFSPKQLEDVPFEGYLAQYMTFMRNNPIDGQAMSAYVTFDPTSQDMQYIALANGELLFNMVETVGLNPIASCTLNETSACYDIPIIQCNSTRLPVIFLDHEGDAEVKMGGNCLTIKGHGPELAKGVDRFLYALFGIMPAS
jgi:hypothetical protein